MGVHPHDLRRWHTIERIVQPFDLSPEQYSFKTVGDLISYVARSISTTPDQTLSIRRLPSTTELQREAFRLLQDSLAEVGGQIPQTIDTSLSPNDVLPVQEKETKWMELATCLGCELPPMEPKGWLSGTVFAVVYALMIALWVRLLYGFGLDKDPVTLVDWIVGGTFTLVMFFVSLVVTMLVSCIVTEFACRLKLIRLQIPFASISELVDHIQLAVETRLQDLLARQVNTTVRDYVIDVTAEEFGLPRDAIDPDFVLPTDSQRLDEQDEKSGDRFVS